MLTHLLPRWRSWSRFDRRRLFLTDALPPSNVGATGIEPTSLLNRTRSQRVPRPPESRAVAIFVTVRRQACFRGWQVKSAAGQSIPPVGHIASDSIVYIERLVGSSDADAPIVEINGPIDCIHQQLRLQTLQNKVGRPYFDFAR